MITPRDTKVYEPKNYRYGEKSQPIQKTVVRDVPKEHTPPSESNWRESNDYRAQYFERNHGIGGYGYICSQCWKPMFKRANMHVDHIIPPSRFAVKKKQKVKKQQSVFGKAFNFITGNKEEEKWVSTSMMARFLNNSFNCAAICPSCNFKKSNKIDGRVIHGYAMKSLEVLYSISQFALSLPFMAVAGFMWGTRKLVVGAIGYSGRGTKKRR